MNLCLPKCKQSQFQENGRRGAGSQESALFLPPFYEFGSVISLPWRPLFAIFNGKVYTPCQYDTVEYISVVEAIKRLNLELTVRTIPVESLQRMDELFVADVMSVLSFSTINKHRLLSVVTSRIADKMEPKSTI